MKIRWISIFLSAALVVITLLYNNCSSGVAFRPGQTQETAIGNPMSPAQLPLVFLSATYPHLPSGHHVLTVGTGKQFSNCQAAVDQAVAGDEVVIDAGFVCTPIILRNKGVLQTPVVIRTANLAQLEPDGTRLQRASTVNLAIIESPNSGPCVTTETSANGYFLDGLEARISSSVTQTAQNIMALGTSNETQTAQFPYNITLSHMWVHGIPNQDVVYGVALNANSVSIVDSIIEELHSVNYRAAGISGNGMGLGPFKIVNNEFLSAGDGIPVNSPLNIPGAIPADIEIRKNYFHKLASWLNPVTTNTGQTAKYYGGMFVKVVGGERVLISGNTFEDNWNTQSPFGGLALELTPRPLGGAVYVVQDVTFTNNIVRNMAGFMMITYHDPSSPADLTRRIDVENNLVYGLSSAYGPQNGMIQLAQAGDGAVVYNHNTILGAQGASGLPLLRVSAGQISNFAFTNNVTNDEGTGVYDAVLGTGSPTLNGDFVGIRFATNVLAGQVASSYSGYMGNNYFPAGLSAIDFSSDPTGGVSDYHTLALSSVSPYFHAAADNTDLGAAIPKIDAAMQ